MRGNDIIPLRIGWMVAHPKGIARLQRKKVSILRCHNFSLVDSSLTVAVSELKSPPVWRFPLPGIVARNEHRAADGACRLRPFVNAAKADVPIEQHKSASLQSALYPFAACSNAAISNFFICIIACMPLGCLMSSPMCAGTTCQRRPNLSLSQPQAISLPPPASSFDQ